MKKADLIVSLPAVPPLLTKWWWLLLSWWLGLWWWWFVLWFHYRCFEKEARQMRKITYMYMYSMAYMMFTLSMKLVMRPKKTRIATWTRLQPAQWGTFFNESSLGKIWFQLLQLARTRQSCREDSPFENLLLRHPIIALTMNWVLKKPGSLFIPNLVDLDHPKHHLREFPQLANSQNIMMGIGGWPTLTCCCDS